jgi:uncharacterized membrane protein
VVPVTRLARLRLGERNGLLVGVAYGLSWGLQQAVAFDFHEIAFAVPLLAFSLESLVLGQWRRSAVLALPLLLVKEDLCATVAAIGVVLVLYGRRRPGASLVAIAAVVGVLVLTVALPAFNPDHTYAYLGSVEAAQTDPFSRLFTPGVKYATVALLLVPTCFVALRSPIVLIALPTLAWRFWSTYPTYWGTGFHYDAVLMPIVFIAFIDGLARLNASGAAVPGWLGLGWLPLRWRESRWLRPRFLQPDSLRSAWLRSRRWLATAAVPVAVAVAVGLLLLGQPLRRLADPGTWRVPEAVSAGKRVLALVPDGADVAASNRLAPQLTSRCRVYLFPMQPSAGLRPDWVVVVADIGPSPIPHETERAAVATLAADGYQPLVSEGGVTLYRLAWPDRLARPASGR